VSPETAPPGDTFEERWPHDAAEAEWLAGPWIPIVLGGLAGIVGGPMIALAILAADWPIVLLVVLALVGLLTMGLLRTRGRTQRRIGRLWRFFVWLVGAALVGIVLSYFSLSLCVGDICHPFGFNLQRPVIGAIVFGLSVFGSIGLAILVDRAGKTLSTRGRATGRP
jgi:hypothetical protein